MKRSAVAPWIATAALLAATAVACEHAERPEVEVDVETLTLRDVLGLSPSFHDALDAAERERLRDRVEAGAEEGWLEGWADEAAPSRTVEQAPPFDTVPEDPLNAMRRLDAWRYDAGEDAWLFGVFLQDAGGVQTFGCAPDFSADGLRADPTADALPEAWLLSGDVFGAEAVASGQERARLRSLAAAIEAWRTRCLDGRDIDSPYERLWVIRQEQAPFLLAYWPQRYTVYVNPLLLSLYGEAGQVEAVAASPLEVVEQAAHWGSFDACASQISALCNRCTREYATANPTECQPLFPGSPIYQDCEAMQTRITDGVIRYCANDFLNTSASALACFQSEGTLELCGVPQNVAIADVDTLGQYYGGFADPSTRNLCRTTLDTCARPPDADGDGVPNPTSSDPTSGDRCNSTPPELRDNVVRFENNSRYGCAASECLDTDVNCMEAQTPPEPEGIDTTCETDCWQIMLNDSGCNDLCGGLIGFELLWFDYERPEIRDTCTEERQPTTCCGEQPSAPPPAR